MNDKVGIIKEIDKLGRIVIPKDLRERFGVDNVVEIIATEAEIVLRSPEYMLVKVDNEHKRTQK